MPERKTIESLFSKVAVIGTGLIGGSLAMCLKQHFPWLHVTGVTRRMSTLRKAKEKCGLDEVTLDAGRAVIGADAVVLATPVREIINKLSEIAPFLKEGAIVTDTGSTKQEIAQAAEKILHPRAFFVGSHPMTGSEKGGVDAADHALFRNTVCIVTRTPGTDRNALCAVRQMWEEAGALVRVMTPGQHDRIVSLVSHLPHALSSALINCVSSKETLFSAGGFRDMTRIAGSSPGLWSDIFLTNRDNVIRAIRTFENKLACFKKALKSSDERAVRAFLSKARSWRAGLDTGKNRKRDFVVAIDGPAGSGKSTVSRLAARKLGFLYVDTGAMYRAITLKALRQNVDLGDGPELEKLAAGIDIKLKRGRDGSCRTFLDGRDVSRLIRSGELTGNVHHVAGTAGVRREMVRLQRKAGRRRKAVIEGRDIGTVVFPCADRKFFLDADFGVRVDRRYRELRAMGQRVTRDSVRKDLRVRDKRDRTRKLAPLRKAQDAVYIDTSKLSVAQVVARLTGYIRAGAP